MNTKILIPLQSGLRLSPEDLAEMCKFVREGGVFNEKSLRKHDSKRASLIAICRVKANGTGNLYNNNGYHYFIRDGLHRCCVIQLVGASTLFEDEYFVEDRKIEDFTVANIDSGWITPFNPILEVRLPDFHMFKQHVLSLPPFLRLDYIMKSKRQYCTSRLDRHARISCTLRTSKLRFARRNCFWRT